jgi:CDP-paratose 2-epimerase
LIGSEAVVHYDNLGLEVHGIDNNMRAQFFGPPGDTRWNLSRLQQQCPDFVHHELDIRDRSAMFQLFQDCQFDLIVHCAAQPSHDRARDIPLDDFDVNAVGTINLLEATRLHCSDAVFIFMSTNKVYGDAPNEIPLVETNTRWDYARTEDFHGISERCRIDQSLHSLFGASKLAADVVAQEYGRYFGLRTGIFRGGCLTGPNHSGVELHGFLSYLAKVAARDGEYTVFGYKGKQVRDQIHSADVIAAFDAFAAAPRPGEVYNLGGGRENSASVLECVTMLEARLGRPVRWQYDERSRRGDHICYISDLRKLKSHFPDWRITRDLESIIDEILEAELGRLGAHRA